MSDICTVTPDFLPDPDSKWFWRCAFEMMETEGYGPASEVAGRFCRAMQILDNDSIVTRIHEANPSTRKLVGNADSTSRTMTLLAGRIWERLGWQPHFVTINLYRSGSDYMNMHQDGPVLFCDRFATISLGGTRTLHMRHRDGKTCRFIIPGGSLYTLEGRDVQRNWFHGVPNENGAAPRISITFGQLQDEAPDDAWSVMDLMTRETLGWGTHEEMDELAMRAYSEGMMVTLHDTALRTLYPRNAPDYYEQLVQDKIGGWQ